MKVILKIISGLILIGLTFSDNSLGQETAARTSFSNLTLDSASDIQTMLEAIESMPPVPYDATSRQQKFGTFWSAQHPEGTRGAWPPLPGNIFGLPLWPLGDGYFLLDDRNVDYAELQAEEEVLAALEKAALPRMKTGRMSLSLLSTPAYGNPIYLTNLVVTSGMTARFDIGGGTNFLPYDIQVTTNPLSDWNWLGIGYTSNSYTFSNQPSEQAFYRLAKPSKTMVVAWGENYFNQCDPPLNLTNAIQIAGGGGYTIALLNSGTVVGWGDRVSEGSVPTNLTGIAMIASGIDHKVVLLTNGTVQVWDGNPIFGQNAVPAGVSNVTVISAQYLHTLALKSDGTIVSWGDPYNPSLTNVPAGLTNATAIAAGCSHNLAVKADGTVVAWGDNTAGQCNVPVGLSNVWDVAAGLNHSVALKKDGTVVAWGTNNYGQTSVPVGLSNVVAIAAGGYPNYCSYTLALKKDGTVVAWGLRKAIAPLNGLNNVIAISAEYDSGLALRTGPPTPVVTLEPLDQYQIAGGDVTFEAKGAGLYGVTYQWQTNGVNLSGATNATLLLTNLATAQQGTYHAVINDNGGMGSIASSNASLFLVTPPVITYQSLPTNPVCIYGNILNFNATATGAGQTNGFPLHYQWQFNGTNIGSATTNFYSLTANDNSSGTYSLVVSNTAGSVTASWHLTVTNAINVTNDLLLIYNTNSADSTMVLNYYLAHRPNVGGANVLGIGYTNPAAPNYFETVTPVELTNQILKPLLTWLSNNPNKRPQYVILFMDLPSRVTSSSWFPTNGYPGGAAPSVSIQLNSLLDTWRPYVTHINMGMTNTVNRTNDCIAYVNKLATIGVPVSTGSPVLSASAGGYANTNFVLDDVRYGETCFNCENYSPYNSVSSATNGLLMAGVPTNAIQYYDGLIVSDYYTNSTTRVTTFLYNGSYITVSNNLTLIHATNAMNLAGYVSWGVHGAVTPDQIFSPHGDSGWWLINTLESWNGTQYPVQSTVSTWFSSTPFGGTNYSNTPVGAVTTVYEPGLSGKNDSSIYLGLWAQGKNFGICAWKSEKSPFFQAVGDPLIRQ